MVPGGCPANKEASILPGIGVVAELWVVVTDAVEVAVVVVGFAFVVVVDCATVEVCVVCGAKSINLLSMHKNFKSYGKDLAKHIFFKKQILQWIFS